MDSEPPHAESSKPPAVRKAKVDNRALRLVPPTREILIGPPRRPFGTLDKWYDQMTSCNTSADDPASVVIELRPSPLGLRAMSVDTRRCPTPLPIGRAKAQRMRPNGYKQ